MRLSSGYGAVASLSGLSAKVCNIRPGSDYDNLYLSLRARSEADRLVVINASQALAIAPDGASGRWGACRPQRGLWCASATSKINP